MEIGERYGRLIVAEKAGKASNGSDLLICVCDCGSSKKVRRDNLETGAIKSCGCLHREIARKSMAKNSKNSKNKKQCSLDELSHYCSLGKLIYNK